MMYLDQQHFRRVQLDNSNKDIGVIILTTSKQSRLKKTS